MTFTRVRGGVLISDPGPHEEFSLEFLAQLDPEYGTYDRETELVTLTGVNRTVVYHTGMLAVGIGEAPSHTSVHAHLVSDTPN
ncbi:MAG TPA: hypothetical protein VGL75_07325 [Acidothermaceae bacterium]|jgi:hypothetical protein